MDRTKLPEPSTQRIDQERAGWVNPKQRPKGPSGRPLCRWCEQEIPEKSGRRTFCSDDCVHEHRIRTDPGYVREAVFKRDQGVCAVCGFDTKTIEPEIRRLAGIDPKNIGAIGRARRQVLAELGIPEHRTTYWDADHIVPVVKGGGSCGLDNYRTLCIPCHRKATADLAAERARLRSIQTFNTARAKPGLPQLSLDIPT